VEPRRPVRYAGCHCVRRRKQRDPLFVRANARIAHEDKAIVESARPAQVPPAAKEKSVAGDAQALAFRKLWFAAFRRGGG